MQIEIAAAGGENEGAINCRRPDDLVLDQLLDVLEHSEADRVLALAPDVLLEPGNRFEIVVEHLGIGGEDDIDQLASAVEVGREHLDGGAGAPAYGQHALPEKAAKLVAERLGLDDDAVRLLQTIPLRGSIPGGVPTDPTIYRFYEMVQVYGTTLKALVHEQFGDGIISAINFKLDIQKIEDPEGGHRAVITLDDAPMGLIGELHPAEAMRLDLTDSCAVFELDLANFIAYGFSPRKTFEPPI